MGVGVLFFFIFLFFIDRNGVRTNCVANVRVRVRVRDRGYVSTAFFFKEKFPPLFVPRFNTLINFFFNATAYGQGALGSKA